MVIVVTLLTFVSKDFWITLSQIKKVCTCTSKGISMDATIYWEKPLQLISKLVKFMQNNLRAIIWEFSRWC